jgi:hypothetical protein
MTEVNFIDGQALTPSSFGQTNGNTGVWEPKRYSGSYGTNGFYLTFQDNSGTTSTTLGKDYSGNGNNWTPNNFSVSAGAGNDSLVDTPTSYGTDTGVGGTVRGNYCTLNPINNLGCTFTNGNLDVSIAQTTTNICVGTTGVASGKWYWEVTVNSGGDAMIGISDAAASIGNSSWRTPNGWAYYSNGKTWNNLSTNNYGASFTVNDVIGVALDMDAGTLVFYKNGVSQGTAFNTGLSGKTITPMLGTGTNDGGAQGLTTNFGQRPFAYSAPSGFKALCTQNLPTPTIGATSTTQADDYFNAVLYTGDRTDRTITVGFQPDWVWVKSRNQADNHYLMNAVVGTGKYLCSNLTDAEATNANTLTAFTSTGFSIGNTGTTNETGRTYVAWNWKANGAGSSNTAGSITSTVSANTTSGFSIVTFTGNSGTAETVGHGLGVAPKMIIVKDRQASTSWLVYQAAVTDTTSKYLVLNSTAAVATATNVWGSALPTSTVFGVNFTQIGGATNNYVAYCFAEVPGYSKFGSYTGNGSSDGPFVFTNFRPRYILLKVSSVAGDWLVWDTARNTYNVANSILYPNLSNAEATSSIVSIDILSNGFKIRTDVNAMNENGKTIIFAAFAESPFKYALAR